MQHLILIPAALTALLFSAFLLKGVSTIIIPGAKTLFYGRS